MNMGATVEIPGSGKKTFNTEDRENLENGAYPGRCIQVIELGTFANTHPDAKPGSTKREMYITFEISELMKDGKPFTVSMRETQSINKQANLFKYLTSWKPELDDLFKGKGAEGQSFAFADILDDTALVNVVTKNGWSDIKGLMPLPRGMNVIERQNPLIDFSLDMINLPVFKELWPYIQNFIKKSEEGIRFFGDYEPTPPKVPYTSEDAPY
jgi:hypothetical protein